MATQKDKILVIGANGQIGTVLAQALRDAYGVSNVIAADIRQPHYSVIGQFEKFDVLDSKRLVEIVRKHSITQIYHLAAILSAKGEQNPRQTWEINMNSLWNVLEVARQEKLHKVYFPSSIAVFGEGVSKGDTPQYSPLLPTTLYGISKTAGELLAQYYFQHYGVDVRSLRYPGLIGYQSPPGGGTTDYAVEIFFKAAAGENYTCFLKADTVLPMMYMYDAIRATLELMEAPAEKIKIRSSYNLHGMSFTPAELTAEIQKHLPNFQVDYQPDFRQAIADSWVQSIDDSAARQDWGWQPKFDLSSMTSDMLKNLSKKRKSSYDERLYL
jgi:nucleoside-diphosphate-sugar epimerase